MTLALIVVLVIVPTFGMGMIKLADQRGRDKQLKTYTVSFPTNLETRQVLNWVTSITGTLRAGPVRLVGVPTVVFEVLASERGLTHRLRVPGKDATYIVSQLRTQVPGVSVTPVSKELPGGWKAVIELGHTNPHRSLNITSPEALSASLLASMQPLKSGEALLMQWVVSPKVPERPPAIEKRSVSYGTGMRVLFGPQLRADRDEVHDRRDKLAEPNMLGMLRLAGRADTAERARELIRHTEQAIASARSAHNRFRVLRFRPGAMERIVSGAAPVNFSAQLSATELVSLIAWPLGNPHVAGLPQGRARHLPAVEAIPRAGRILAISTFPGGERALAVSPIASCGHVHIVGGTGSGKTALMANLIAQDVANGSGVVAIEAKGDLFHEALSYIPAHRLNDVVVLDVTDESWPVGFNILVQGRPQVVASELQNIFTHIYGKQGIRMPEALFHGLITLITTTAAKEPLTFVDLMPLFAPMGREEVVFAETVIGGVQDSYIRAFWTGVSNMTRVERDKFFEPLRDRIWTLNNRPEVRNIIGQSRSSFNIAEIVRSNKILLVNLAGLGKETAGLLGTLIINNLWHAVKDGAANPKNPTHLYLDEMQLFLNLPIDPADMLAQARSFGLAMHLAHQHMDQLPNNLKSAVLNNAKTQIVFQTGSDDARVFANEMGSLVSVSDFQQLRQYEVIARIATNEGVSPPVTARTIQPLPREGLSRKARLASRTRYGRPVADVEAEIRARRLLGSSGTSKPRVIGQTNWQSGGVA